MADPKQQIMDQVRQQAALSNARALVEVHSPAYPLANLRTDADIALLVETQRTLFRAMRTQTWHLPLISRNNMLSELYGKVHAGVEYSQSAVFGTRTERRRGTGRRWRRQFRLIVMKKSPWGWISGEEKAVY